VIRSLVAALALAAALPAAAQPAAAQPAAAQGSPRWGTFEVSLGGYRPNIDAEFGGSSTPYQAAFGGNHNPMLRVDFAKAIFTGQGELDVGIGVGYWEKYGHGFNPSELGGGPSSDPTAIKIVPTRLSLTYRFDQLAEQYRWLPLAPYVRFSLERYNWWVNNGSGDTAKAGSRSGYGSTNGYSISGGVAVLLDSIDPDLAREADRDTGINHTYLFVDFTKSSIKEFGSSSSWDLSPDRNVVISGGILFVF
jgi:hypothetical protein